MEEAYVARIIATMKVLAQKPKEATLLAFGGAGPMSACRVAEGMGIKEIIIPRMAAVFSAFGIGFSDIAHSYNGALHDHHDASFKKLLHRFEQSATRDMYAEGFSLSECRLEKSVSFVQNGEEATRQLNGESKLPDGLQKASDVRLQYRATKEIPHFVLKAVDTAKGNGAKSKKTRTLQLAEAGSAKLKATELPLYKLAELAPGDWAQGPAIVEEEYFTCFVAQGWNFLINENHDIVMNKA
jgi:N-methylhydantoinase A/oxoprolinase/acetone carboxylase beta subunit